MDLAHNLEGQPKLMADQGTRVPAELQMIVVMPNLHSLAIKKVQ